MVSCPATPASVQNSGLSFLADLALKNGLHGHKLYRAARRGATGPATRSRRSTPPASLPGAPRRDPGDLRGSESALRDARSGLETNAKAPCAQRLHRAGIHSTPTLRWSGVRRSCDRRSRPKRSRAATQSCRPLPRHLPLREGAFNLTTQILSQRAAGARPDRFRSSNPLDS